MHFVLKELEAQLQVRKMEVILFHSFGQQGKQLKQFQIYHQE